MGRPRGEVGRRRGLRHDRPPCLVVDTQDGKRVGIATVVDAQRVDGPAANPFARAKPVFGAVQSTMGKPIDHREHALREPRCRIRVRPRHVRDVRLEILDRLRRVYDSQRLRTASRRRCTSAEPTPSPRRRASKAVWMPASSSGVSGESSSTGSMTYRPAGRARSSSGRSLPFHLTTTGMERPYLQVDRETREEDAWFYALPTMRAAMPVAERRQSYTPSTNQRP